MHKSKRPQPLVKTATVISQNGEDLWSKGCCCFDNNYSLFSPMVITVLLVAVLTTFVAVLNCQHFGCRLAAVMNGTPQNVRFYFTSGITGNLYGKHFPLTFLLSLLSGNQDIIPARITTTTTSLTFPIWNGMMSFPKVG